MVSPISPHRIQFNQRLSFWAILLLVVLVIGIYHLRNTWKTPPVNKRSVQRVVITKAKQSDVPVYLSALGSVVPTYTVTVKSLINGQLINVFFKEGQEIKKGDLLAEIDPRPYHAQLMQYQGQLQRDQALLANARVDLVRYQKLWKQDSVAQQTVETQQSLVEQYKGAVQTDTGLIENVRVQLGYTKITSPIDGRVGLRLVDPGNIVQTSDVNGLVVINTLNPITIIFSIPEDNIPDVMEKFRAEQGLTVQAYDRQQNRLLEVGKLLTVDNQINPTTGTVKLKAEFNNNAGSLFANQFVNIQLLVKTLFNVVTLPTEAIQYTPTGAMTFVVNANQTVTSTPIKPGITSDHRTVILSGIQPGQSVVIEGADKLENGMKVQVSERS